MRASRWFWSTVAYAAFVVYASLIPFELRAVSFDEAVRAFSDIRMLNLGAASRADWIANILLYIPLGALLLGLAARLPALAPHRAIAAVPALLACAAIAVAVEFTQIYFAPRTVSLNDLLAEGLGSLLGIALYLSKVRALLPSWTDRQRRGGPAALQVSLFAYALAYLLVNLFPFDFVLSVQELREKLASPLQGLLFAPVVRASPLRAVARLGVEMVMAVPIGALLAVHFAWLRSRWLGTACAWALLVGGGLEMIQSLLVSGVGQGASVLMRAIGIVAGAGLWLSRSRRERRALRVPSSIGTLVICSIVPYLAVVTALAGWFEAPWTGIREGFDGLRPQMFIPFYFHYFSTEASAVTSALANAGMYAPIGLGLWAWVRAKRVRPWSAGVVGLTAALCAGLVEAGKLFVPGKHPDPSNLLLAAAGACCAHWALKWFETLWVAPSAEQQAAGAAAAGSLASKFAPAGAAAATSAGVLVGAHSLANRSRAPAVREPVRAPGLVLARPAAVIVGLLAAILLFHYPLHRVLLAAGLLGYAFALSRSPNLWLVAVPAALPVLDFADWTGWSLVDEFDIALLVTLSVLLWRGCWPSAIPRRDRWVGRLIAGYAIVFIVSLVRGLWSPEPFDANAGFSYLSHYHALRTGKGILWALVFWPFLRAAFERGGQAPRLLSAGVLAGLASTCAAMLWERSAFVGLLDVSTGYRATGFFTSVNTGGGAIDAYLALSLPFVAACFLSWRSRLSFWVGMPLLGVGVYSSLVTFSRINYLAMAVSGAVIFVSLLRGPLTERRFYAIVIPAILIAAAVLVPFLAGPFMQYRLATLPRDLDVRLHEWRRDLSALENDWMTRLFGAGVGSFPRVRFWHESPEQSPAAFSLADDGGNRFLRLGSGTPVYIIQRLPRPLPERATMRYRTRAPEGGALGVDVCEKSLLYSLRCITGEARRLIGGQPPWAEWELGLDLSSLRNWRRPAYLSVFHNTASEKVVEVDKLSLRSDTGAEMLVNGEFEEGSERWYFTSDDHTSWRIDNLWLHVLFEQGWIGLVATMSLLVAALVGSYRGFVMNEPLASLTLAALAGFLTVGLTNSLIEAARIAFLLLLIAFTGLLRAVNPVRAAGRSG